MKQLIVSLLLLLQCVGCTEDKKHQELYRFIERIAPQYQDNIIIKIEKDNRDNDYCELETINNKLLIRGNSKGAITRGIKHYLTRYCYRSTSWCGDNMNLPEIQPKVNPKEIISSPFEYRYYLNYCTHSYSMAFWDWTRWEKEIDWMALNGINITLAITGQSKVWQNTLRRLEYSEDDINAFIPGPAFEAWWLMGNLEGWGGGVPQEYIDNRAILQKKIVNRMRELGIEPVLQGFYGMVPHASIKKYPDADIRDVGTWCGYRRPAFLTPEDPLFEKFSTIFYEEQKKLYGENKFFGGDPFHEGGQTKGINVTKAGERIFTMMNQENNGATWVLQAWQNNPRTALLKGIPKKKAIVLDLWGEVRPQWGGTTSLWKRDKGFIGHDWIWCTVPNFGGNTGIYGKIETIAEDAYFALKSPKNKGLSGIGSAMEGIGTYPVVYDFIYDLGWTENKIDIDQWIASYAKARYGILNKEINQAWSTLLHSVYSCPRNKGAEGCPENILCARPKEKIKSVSSWGKSDIYYNPQQLIDATSLLLSQSSKLHELDTYQYDVVDFVRQIMAIKAQKLHMDLEEADKAENITEVKSIGDQLLQLILDEEKLLMTRKEFLVGQWIQQARNMVEQPKNKDLMEWNARTQITSWGNRHAANKGGLHDYAHKEWVGVLSQLYYPRWEKYIHRKIAILKGEKPKDIDWFALEDQWSRSHIETITSPQGDAADTAIYMFNKYSQL
ncbi:alpha-N-acetylglucosaminidase [Halosquirtibacter xylanolyticus]|uniref:alpha-N-acetylglucosaminidase n=1 Tax=Halosquirtibacter xylanolyticus TaxID=3374599 RepID=UPI0037497925|nr:alpha-N-acetylglucosaminidase [Prolixibacteraceae bacterium]